MPIEIDGTEYRTEAQWERVRRHVRKNAKGVEREWKSPAGGKARAVFYPRSQTRGWTQAEKNKASKAKREAKAEKEIQRRIAEAVEAERERTREHWRQVAASDRECEAWLCTLAPVELVNGGFATDAHTAREWVEAGFVPLDVARWDYSSWLDRFTCRWWDVRYDRRRAEELESMRPDGPDDGLPWWVDEVKYLEDALPTG